MRLVFDVSEHSDVLATLDNMVLAFEIAFLPIIQAKLLLLLVSGLSSLIPPGCSWYSVSVDVQL
jgi:hypothetical protein